MVAGKVNSGAEAQAKSRAKLRTKAKKKCGARGCKNKFVPVVDWQKYCSRTCSLRESQQRFRQKYRELRDQAGQSADDREPVVELIGSYGT